MNKWTLALAVAGIISTAAVVTAEEAENQVLTAVSGTTVSGYVDVSMNWQFGDLKTSSGRSLVNNANHQNGFNVDAVKLSVGKALEDDASTWDAGYQADLIFGDLANIYSAGRLASNIALQNAYVDLRVPIGNGLDVRAGLFQTVVGYESDDAYLNPNISRSYGYDLEPRHHGGALASYHFDLSDWILGVHAGVANTYTGNRSSDSVRLTYLGALNLVFPESTGFLEGTEIYGGVVSGVDADNRGYDAPNTANYYAGITLPLPVTGLRLGFSYDYRHEGSDNTWDGSWANAYAAYLAYDVTEKLTLANRIEYANGKAGTWTVAANDWGKEDEYLSDTFTLSYKLWENVVTRAEFRWDHDLSGDHRMVDTADRSNAFGITGNIVYVF
ncbi:MAG: outer membrane beta-barrel protein [Verrucomicrobia bacterium]|nr:outer membrane beta-barrel protein [Verrucomicrobiota bacterium]